MGTTSSNSVRRTTTLVVAVRVPNGADGDLATEAERRLSLVAGVDDATVDGLRGLEPRLSATVVTVAVTLAVVDGGVGDGLVDALDETSGVEAVEVTGEFTGTPIDGPP